MAFHGTASVLQGTPWHSMELHHYFMELHANSVEFHGGISHEVAVTPATDPVTVVVG